MKKTIAGAALITTMLSTGVVAWAETPALTPSAEVVATASQTAESGATAGSTDPTTTANSGDVQESTTSANSGDVEETTTSANSGDAEDATTSANSPGAVVVSVEAPADLPEAGLTPDSFFYGFKVLVERVQVMITTDAAQRAALLEAQAQTRLAEAKAMAEAGKDELAEKALKEAQAKLAEAQKAIQAATSANRELGDLKDRVEADQAKYAAVLTNILEKAPEELREQLEPVVTDLLVEVAATQDTVVEDEEAAEEAEAVAQEVQLEEELSGVAPRTVLVLKAMAEASGRDLAEVVGMYQENPGLGRIAKALGLKMGPVQHAAQLEWKAIRSGVDQDRTEDEAEADEAESGLVEDSEELDLDLDEDRDADEDRDEDEDRGDDEDEAKAKVKAENQGQQKKAIAASKSNGKAKGKNK